MSVARDAIRYRSAVDRYLESSPRLHVLGASLVIAMLPIILVVNLWQPTPSAIELADGSTIDHAAAVTLIRSSQSWGRQLDEQAKRHQALQASVDVAGKWIPPLLNEAEFVAAIHESTDQNGVRVIQVATPTRVSDPAIPDVSGPPSIAFWRSEVTVRATHRDLCAWMHGLSQQRVPVQAASIAIWDSGEEDVMARLRLSVPTLMSDSAREIP